jgi:hypothetical protein
MLCDIGWVVITGNCGSGVRLDEEVPVPPGVVTLTFPVVQQLLFDVNVMLVELTTVNDATVVPPTVTEVVPMKFVPVIVTVSPYATLVVLVRVEIKLVIVGTNAVHFAYKIASAAVLYVPVPAT